MPYKGFFRSIFCVDDDKTDLYIAEKYLKGSLVNPEVMLFMNGKNAIDKLMDLRQADPGGSLDSILLDLNMPVMNGWAFPHEIYRMKIDLWCNYGYTVCR